MKRSQRAPVVMPSELISIDHPFYNSPTVHKEMLFDTKRTLSFKKALKKLIKKGDKVYDLGTGTGILAMFAATYGAGQVYASDAEHGMYEAVTKHVKDNNLAHKIKTISYKGKPIKLPQKVDLIVSECLGHFAFDEGMIQAVAASKYLLKDNGQFVPNRVRLYIAATSNPLIYQHNIEPWKKRIYGFDFSSMRQRALQQIYIGTFDKPDIISQPLKIIDYEFGQPANFLTGAGVLKIKKSATMYGLVGWFEADLAQGVVLSTSPFTKKTHWEQSFLALPQTLRVAKNDKIKIKLSIRAKKGSKQHTVFEWGVEKGGGGQSFRSQAIV